MQTMELSMMNEEIATHPEISLRVHHYHPA
jgi:hypothetical protein